MFEKSTWIRLPRNVVVGHGVLDQTIDAVEELHLAGRPLVVSSPTPHAVAGERVVDQFADHGYDPSEIVIEEASFDAVQQVIAHAKEVVVADTAILAEAPWRLTTAGCADIISNYTAVRDWELAHRLKNVHYSEYAGALSQMTAEMLVESADSIKRGLEESSWIVVKALVSSGVAMSIAGSSRPASGAEHLFSHQLDRIAPDPGLHGHQVGVGSIMTEYLHSGPKGQWEDVHDALASIGAPTTADALGIDDETVIEALTTAHEIRDRYTVLGDGMSEEAAIEAATVTGVI